VKNKGFGNIIFEELEDAVRKCNPEDNFSLLEEDQKQPDSRAF